ncbi:MAG: DciA family protein, partial [bacterium]
YNPAMAKNVEFEALSKLLAAAPTRGRHGDAPAPSDAQRRLGAFWRAHLGAAARCSEPLLFASGRLVVFVESAAWGTEIRHRAPSLIAALAEFDIVVRAIEVKMRVG